MRQKLQTPQPIVNNNFLLPQIPTYTSTPLQTPPTTPIEDNSNSNTTTTTTNLTPPFTTTIQQTLSPTKIYTELVNCEDIDRVLKELSPSTKY